MGRAIDMEKDINILNKRVSVIEELEEKSTKTKHIDLTEVKNETKKEETNDEGNGDSSKSTNNAKSKSSKKSK